MNMDESDKFKRIKIKCINFFVVIGDGCVELRLFKIIHIMFFWPPAFSWFITKHICLSWNVKNRLWFGLWK